MAEAKQARLLYTPEEVDLGIKRLAGKVIDHYPEEDTPVFVFLLNGAMPFFTDLMRSIKDQRKQKDRPNFDPKAASMIVSTYGHGTEALSPRIVADLAPNVEVDGKRILVVDDLVDTGITMKFVSDLMTTRGAIAVESCVLVQKVGNPKPAIYGEAAFHVFESPYGQWLYGMGMDGDPNANEGSDAARWERGIWIVEDVPVQE